MRRTLLLETLEDRLVLSAGLPLPQPAPAFIVAPPDPGEPAVPAETEPNDSLAQANPLVLTPSPIFWAMRGPFTGVLTKGTGGAAMPAAFPWFDDQFGSITGSSDNSAAANDVDYFSFKTAAERKIDLTLDGAAVAAGAVLQLLDADGNLLAVGQTDDTGGTDVPNWATLSYYASAGGAFFVRIGSATAAAAPAAGAYTLSASVAADPWEEHEPNDSFDTANALAMMPSYPGIYGAPAPMAAGAGTVVGNAVAMPIWWQPGTQHGFVSGQIDAPAGGVADQDFFSFQADAKHTIHIELNGDLTDAGGRVALYDSNQQPLAIDSDSGDGLALDWTTQDSGTFYVRVDQPAPSAGAASSATPYWLDITTQRIPNPIEGPDELEPNDAFAQSNTVVLDDIAFDDSSAITLRTGAALGIAGGPSRDQDVFQFAVQAGEHAQVGIDGFICDPLGDVFASIKDLSTGRDFHTNSTTSLQSILQRHPEWDGGVVRLAVFDAQGNFVGGSSDNGFGPGGVVFDAAAAGTYYAVISVAATANTDLVHYRLSVFAENSTPAPGDNSVQPLVKVLHAGQAFNFTDASGQRVHLAFQGRRGTATVKFTGAHAAGSNIASIVVNGVAGGNLLVQSAGGTHVGAVTIHGMRRRHRVVGSFGQVKIDGNLGSFSSDTSTSKLAVSRFLGALSAPGQTIARVKADRFDAALIQAASVKMMQAQNDVNAVAIQSLVSAGKLLTGPTLSLAGSQATLGMPAQSIVLSDQLLVAILESLQDPHKRAILLGASTIPA